MSFSWVLVADNSQASVYRFDRHKHELTLVDHIDHEEGRWKNSEFVTASPGMSVGSSVGGNVRQVGTDHSPKEHESINFAHLLAKSVNHAHDLHQFETLRVCAPPGLLGELLPLISSHVPLGEHINKDLIHESPDELLKRLTELH
ncbi:host attachment protein [Endozoicomonas ascidiicola]|uniref:host attachment protein n=1 Tax=Endozoicomonas ascidiicola TaxID=1698521 RepID=UPI000829FAF7|nr:host attachment protein [Endozoicomonas ascidiicola]